MNSRNGANVPSRAIARRKAAHCRRSRRGFGRLARPRPLPDRAPHRQRRLRHRLRGLGRPPRAPGRGQGDRAAAARPAGRVLREAQAAARLNHPGIVTLYEMGEEDGNALLVTELVEGSTLARLSRAGELSATARSARSAPTSARRSTTPTRAASSTATSSRRTCSSTEDGEPRGEADGLRRRPPRRRRGADRARRRRRHPRLHGARAGRGPRRPGPRPTSTRWR